MTDTEQRIAGIIGYMPLSPNDWIAWRSKKAKEIASSLVVDEGKVIEIAMLTITKKAEQQHLDQIDEVDKKGLWDAELKSWSFEEMIGFLCEAIANSDVIRVKEGGESEIKNDDRR